MPHVSIKHFPADLDADRRSRLVEAVAAAVQSAFGCDDGAISIALEAVEPAAWQDRVYGPEIQDRKHLLAKVPRY